MLSCHKRETEFAIRCLRGCALCQLLGDDTLTALLLVLGLHAEDVSTPDVTGSLVVLALEGLSKLGELTLVLVLDGSQAESGGGLLVHNGTQAGLSLREQMSRKAFMRWGSTSHTYGQSGNG